MASGWPACCATSKKADKLSSVGSGCDAIEQKTGPFVIERAHKKTKSKNEQASKMAPVPPTRHGERGARHSVLQQLVQLAALVQLLDLPSAQDLKEWRDSLSKAWKIVAEPRKEVRTREKKAVEEVLFSSRRCTRRQ